MKILGIYVQYIMSVIESFLCKVSNSIASRIKSKNHDYLLQICIKQSMNKSNLQQSLTMKS